MKLVAWSNILSASRIEPSEFKAINSRAGFSIFIFSFLRIKSIFLRISGTVNFLKSNLWHLERIVGIILWTWVVAKIKMIWEGGSSKVFKRALAASLVN
ncbi:hypothetical protein AMJ49_02730 [Parcubacteria bacterium DG_74_2]|nr:MAG: hypothetical protein AMJ49_02730 [Parcubacteria bacterium DG_74_2]